MTPQQISDAAFKASGYAWQLDQHLAAAAMHTDAIVNGLEKYRFGHERAAMVQAMKAKACSSKEATAKLNAQLRSAAQIGR